MEKKQYDLCTEVLRRLEAIGALKQLILVGSWCIPFYQEYFKSVPVNMSIRTRDIDFMAAGPVRLKIKVDLASVLKDIGFVVGFQGREGYIRLEHPDLAVEFLAPEKGAGMSKPIVLGDLGVNAQPLRYLHLLSRYLIKTKVCGVTISLPHPAMFAFHKLIVSSLRKNNDKAEKDRSEASIILTALYLKKESALIRRYFDTLPPKGQAKVLKLLKSMAHREILGLLNK